MGSLWRKYAAVLLAGILVLSAAVTATAGTIEENSGMDAAGISTRIDDTQSEDTADTQETHRSVEGEITQDEGGPARGEITQDEHNPVTGEITQDDNGVKADILTDTSADDNVVITQNDKPYLALGANLNKEQKNTVLSLMGIDPADLDQYHVVAVTNEEEHQYLDNYLDASTIGSRALSSVVIVKREKGDGIHISTKNISYCTIGMYKNALATAGLEDADVIVAGPFPISGTAALIGAMKAYADMENVDIDAESLDAAMNEIVVTGELVDSLGNDGKSEEFMAYIKQQVLERGRQGSEDIHRIIEEACGLFDISITDSQQSQIASLMEKVGALDIDVDSLLEQAGSIYESIASMKDSGGFMSSIADFFKGIVDAVAGFFKGLF